jgi:hypothetical protein
MRKRVTYPVKTYPSHQPLKTVRAKIEIVDRREWIVSSGDLSIVPECDLNQTLEEKVCNK